MFGRTKWGSTEAHLHKQNEKLNWLVLENNFIQLSKGDPDDFFPYHKSYTVDGESLEATIGSFISYLDYTSE